MVLFSCLNLLTLLTIMIKCDLFFPRSGVCHLSGDVTGERWVPHTFFSNLIRTSSEETHLRLMR